MPAGGRFGINAGRGKIWLQPVVQVGWSKRLAKSWGKPTDISPRILPFGLAKRGTSLDCWVLLGPTYEARPELAVAKSR